MRDTRYEIGSALILAVVLTSLLAIIGVMFVMVARLDRISTSALSDTKDLDLAVETVVAKIADELVLDTPGIAGLNTPLQDYYDYPDVNNLWLANLEPCSPAAGVYTWRHISDIYGVLDVNGWDLPVDIVGDYEQNISAGLRADADGDGVADSRWIVLADMTGSKGKPIFAAVRVVDNGGMLNVNTAYKFDPNNPDVKASDIDGSSQMQINLMALAGRDRTHTDLQKEDRLWGFRCGSAPNDISKYEKDVVWRYGNATGGYIPFDISDELKLRNRYILNYNKIATRIEKLWTNAYDDNRLQVPRTEQNCDLTKPENWFYHTNNSSPDPNLYNYRHISTTCNIDRAIAPRVLDPCAVGPDRNRMVNLNRIESTPEELQRQQLNELYSGIYAGLYDAGFAGVGASAEAAQIAVNIKDYADADSDVSTYKIDDEPYYGFERPCAFISELTYRYTYIAGEPCEPGGPRPMQLHHSYAIEICKRYSATNGDTWQLVVPRYGTVDITGFGRGKKRYEVVVFEDANVPLAGAVVFSDPPENGETDVDPNVVLSWPCLWMNPNCSDPNFQYDVYFGPDCSDAGDCNNLCDNVKDADHNSPEFISNQKETSFDPYGLSIPMAPITYCWRIDDIHNGKRVAKGDAWSFTVGDPKPKVLTISPGDIVFGPNDIVEVRRYISPTDFIVVDSVIVRPWLVDVNGWSGEGGELITRTFQRDMTDDRFIKRLWDVNGIMMNSPTLGHSNNYTYPNTEPIPISFGRFNNIGEIGKVLLRSAYFDKPNPIGLLDNEVTTKINLAEPIFQQLFNYLTIWPPSKYDPNETRIKGRINVNTAPWYVIAQLPWVSTHTIQPDGTNSYALAKAIVNHRDNVAGPFRSIGQLNNVVVADPNSSIDYYWRKDSRAAGDQMGYPDLSIGSRTRVDGVADDFEERDLIFARISNLVTVRSDVFTAYILVRVGENGPQKRVVAILDRSGISLPEGKVKIVALQPVPDPR